jgi:DNA-3-methyladenine glycosylase II
MATTGAAMSSGIPTVAGDYREAARWLAERDPVIARLVDVTGLPQIAPPTEAPFAALVRAITQQQIATPAARAIYGRLRAALHDDVSPRSMVALTVPELRAVGLSGNKATSLLDLATKTLDGTLDLEPVQLTRQSDEEIVRRLTTVRGIGKWSAEMFLMFQLLRLDVWPTGDLAVRKGYAMGWNVEIPTPKQLDAIGEAYRPYRSIAAWYCWAALRAATDTGFSPTIS